MNTPPTGADAPEPIHRHVVPGGAMWSKILHRGLTLRLTDPSGGANAALLLYNADERSERYNMPDTLKGQQTFYLTHPHCLHSDMGRLLASITRDDAGWHDTVCGSSDARLVADRYGGSTFQQARNAFHRNGHDCFLIELAKWGLGRRDLVPNINFFSKVTADASGDLTFHPAPAGIARSVDLRFEMNCLAVLHTCQHPLDPNPRYEPKPVQLEIFRTSAPGPDDPCIGSHPENRRAYENTSIYNLLRFPNP